MRPVTERFSGAIVQSHRLAVLVEVLQAGAPTGETLTTVDAGSVTLDAKAQARGRVDLTVVDDGSLGLVPTVPADPLAPYGRELRVSRGIRFPDDTTELVSLGVFRIDDTSIDDSADGLAIQISGLDRSARITDARFEEPYQIAAGTNLATAILALIQAAYPTVVYDFTPTAVTTPAVIAQEGDDRWALAQQLAAAAGLRLYFDGDGTLILEPEATGDPVISLAEGASGVLLRAARRWTRQGAFNAVIATGQNTGQGAPVRGVARDLNPLSPTYYFGPFGKVPRFFQSQFMTTTQQCEDAATAMLARELGTTQTVSFGSLVLPQLEPGDVATITRARAGVDEDYVIDQLTIPLVHASPITGAARARQVTS